MKKLISINLSLIILLGCVFSTSLLAQADTSSTTLTSGYFKYNTLDDNTIEIIQYTGDEEKLSIPAQINNKTVTSINGNAFRYNKTLKTVTFSEGLTDINGYAFYNCLHLETVNLPKTLNYVADHAFDGCNSLQNFTIGGSLSGHGNEFVGNGGNLLINSTGRGYFVKDGVLFANYDKYITNALKTKNTNHNRLEKYPSGRTGKTYAIPADTMWIMSEAFSSLSFLEEVTIPSSVVGISPRCFVNQEENLRQPLTIVFQHLHTPENLSYSCVRNMANGSKIIVKNEDAKAEFEAEASNFIYNSSGESTVTIEAQETPTTSLSLSSTELSLKINDTTTIEATQTPCTTTDNLVFSSSDESVVAFDKHGFGRLTAKGIGTAVVTVTSGSVSNQCSVTVYCEHETTATKNQALATCVKNGYTGDETCTICGETISTGEVIPATGHNYVYEESKEATCTADGFVGAGECSTCGNTVAKEIKHATGHQHLFDWTVVQEPSCGTAGLKHNYCVKCEQTIEEEIPALEHNFTSTVTTEASCAHYGIVVHSCSTCGDTDVEIIPKKSHSYTIKNTKSSTCKNLGETTYTCTECGDSYTRVVAKLSHILKTTSKKATCFTCGYENRKTCTCCGKVVSKGKTIQKLALSKPVVKYSTKTKKLIIKYTKVNGATGFQVRYKRAGTNKFYYKTFKTTKSATKYIKNLKKNKKYYVRVRAYKIENTNTVYSAWSAAKSIKIK